MLKKEKTTIRGLFVLLINPSGKLEYKITYTYTMSIGDPNELFFDEIGENKETCDKHYNNQ